MKQRRQFQPFRALEFLRFPGYFSIWDWRLWLYFEDYLEGVGAKWAHLGGGDYAVTLKTEST